ncbi:erythroid membrane-associated protein-like [Spea bombifrons]|uniref:erythroid membrane-associated protein-like n=1 Tax=Spea bombifrons TaxID=233779 RepID=UPI00234AA1FE|nr:erythroid membrane-associated protein-like [Spea bombifrons]
MTPDLSNGRLDLTLTRVEHRDEGVYVCQVTNPVDYRDIEVRLTVIAPVSDPLLNLSCRPDGSAEISCRAQNGSDPTYSLSVNGRIKLKDFHSSVSGSGVNITVSSAAPWNISCSVRTRISERNSSLISESCPGSVPTVTAVLHGTAVLPCSVPFISGTEDLLVSWVKKIGTKPSLVLLAFNEGQFDLKHQAPQYRGRTNMSPDLSNGRLDLTLTHVKHRDEGVYVCQVMNTANHRDTEVRLTVIAPVSDPLLNLSCRPDGSAEISCWTQNGSDPVYSLSVNGRIELEDFHSSVSGSGVNITVSSAAAWNISCSVRNRISERNSSLISESCPESGASGGDRGRRGLWICVGLLCTAGGLLGCCCFYR